MERAPSIDRERHPRRRIRAAESDDLIGAIVLVGGALEQCAGHGTLDLRVRARRALARFRDAVARMSKASSGDPLPHFALLMRAAFANLC
jgi:hypothetical protein